MIKDEYPKLRDGLEGHTVEHSGKKMLLLRDRTGFTPQSLIFSPPVVSILVEMNGSNSLRDLQANFMRQTGQLLHIDELKNLVETLDENLFLDNDRFRSFAAKEISEFLGSPVRKMRYAGISYPENPAELRAKLHSFFDPESGGPGFPAGRTPATPARPLALWRRISTLTPVGPVSHTPIRRPPRLSALKPG